MKSSQIAAAFLAALATSGAHADSMEYSEKVMCVPAYIDNDKVYIAKLCDATDLNKKYNIKIDENGCAFPGQSLEVNNGYLINQGSVSIWGSSKEEFEKQMLPVCTEEDAAVYFVEL